MGGETGGSNATLDDLFRERVTVSVRGRELTLRALSDIDIQARDRYALLAQAEQRRLVGNEGSEEYAIYMGWMEAATETQLKNLILSVASSALMRQVFTEVEPTIIPMPDGAEEEEKLDVLARREAEEKRVSEARQKWYADAIQQLATELDGLDSDTLLKRARRAQLDLQGRLASQRAFELYTIYATVFTDPECAKHYVPNADAAGNLTPEMRGELISTYHREMERVKGLDLIYFLSTDRSPDSAKP